MERYDTTLEAKIRHLQSAGLVSRKEAGRIAARLRVETGADVIFSP